MTEQQLQQLVDERHADYVAEDGHAVQLKDVPKGEYFKRKQYTSKVYVRGEYYRDTKKYQCDSCEDIWGNGIQLKGTTIVYIGFTY